LRVTLPLDDLEDELLEDDLAPLDFEPPELALDFEPPDELLGLLMPARPPLLDLDPDDRVEGVLPLLVDPDRVALVPLPDLEPELVDGRLTLDDPRLGVPLDDRVDESLPDVNEPRLRHEPDVASFDFVVRLGVSDVRSDPEELILAPPMVVMTRCAGSFDPALPRRQSSFAAAESFFTGARVAGLSASRVDGLLRVRVPVSSCFPGAGFVSAGLAGADGATGRGRTVPELPLVSGVGFAGAGRVTVRGLAVLVPSPDRVAGVGFTLSLRGLTAPSRGTVPLVPDPAAPPSDRVPVDGVGRVTVCPVPPRVTVPPAAPPVLPVVPRVTTPGSLEPGTVTPPPAVPRVVCVVCVSRVTPRVTRSRTDAEGLGSLWKNCVTSAGDPAPWPLPVPLPLLPRMIRSATRDGSLISSLFTRTVWFESTPRLPSRASRLRTSSAVRDARSIRFEKRPFRSTTVYARRSFDAIVILPLKP
jgi:hypothetical protein